MKITAECVNALKVVLCHTRDVTGACVVTSAFCRKTNIELGQTSSIGFHVLCSTTTINLHLWLVPIPGQLFAGLSSIALLVGAKSRSVWWTIVNWKLSTMGPNYQRNMVLAHCRMHGRSILQTRLHGSSEQSRHIPKCALYFRTTCGLFCLLALN